jgi:hypothetical protein
MIPTRTTDLPYRLRELSKLRALVADIARDAGLSADERNGIFIADSELFHRMTALSSSAGCGGVQTCLSLREAGQIECGLFAVALAELRRAECLNDGERSGIREVLIAVEARAALMAEGPRLLIAAIQSDDAAEQRGNLQWLAERMANQETATEGRRADDGALPVRGHDGRRTGLVRWTAVVFLLTALSGAAVVVEWWASL